MADKRREESAQEKAAREWLETKDHQHAWNRLVGHRVRAVREQIQREERRQRDAEAPGRGGREPRWMRSVTKSSQQAIAASIARTQSWLSKLERGERSISVGDAYLFAEYFGVDPLRFVGPPTAEERKRFDLDLQDIRRAREKAGLTPETVSRLKGKARNGRRRASPVGKTEERKRAR